MAHRYSSNITLSGAANVDEHLDVGVSGRHVVEQRCGLRIGCSLADIHGRTELTQQDASAWRFDRFVKVFEVLENVVEVKQTLTAAIVVRRRSAASTFGVSVVAGSSKSKLDIRSFLAKYSKSWLR